MLRSSSPNDPVFYLNHCNVDRIWSAWMTNHNPDYLPAAGTPGAPAGHRIDDAMVSLLGPSSTPQEMLDVSEFYSYDSLVVA